MQTTELASEIVSHDGVVARQAKYRYDAFISYSHDPRQSAITAALQQAVQRFAKPFWRRRAVSLFRDQTNLSTNPNLWGMIVDALSNSRFLILMASPKAAESLWVAKEVEWWLSHRGHDTIVIVLVTGSLLWSGSRFSDAETTALPMLARGAFTAEPLWLDLTSIATDPVREGWQRNARFLDAVASIASRLRDIPKEDLFGEDLKRHKQTRRVIGTTITVISALLIVAIGAAVFAEWQRRIAVRRADETAAAFIWSRLDFEELDDPRTEASVQSLWALATASEGVRDAFLAQLAQDRYQVDKLAKAPATIARAFGLRLRQWDSERLLTTVLDAIRQTSDPSQLHVLAQAVQALGPKPEQAQAALGPILDAIRQTTEPLEFETLAQAAQTLGPKPEQAQAALGPILEAIRQTTDPYQRLALALAVQTLRPKLAPEQAQAALGPVLDAIRQTTFPAALHILAQALQTLGPKPEQAQLAIEVLRTVLSRTDGPDAAEGIARAIAVTLPLDPQQPAEYVAGLIELLKWPTIVGPGTDALLEVLHERMPAAPGKEAGLDATVAWVAKTYPDIDLDSPPTCPPSVCGDALFEPDWTEWLKALADPMLTSVTTAIRSTLRSFGIATDAGPPTS